MDTMEIDGYEPDYEDSCMNCEQSPTVTAVSKGEVVYQWHLCGPCMFGTAQALDSTTWNTGDY